MKNFFKTTNEACDSIKKSCEKISETNKSIRKIINEAAKKAVCAKKIAKILKK